MNKLKTFKNCVLYILLVSILVGIEIFLAVNNPNYTPATNLIPIEGTENFTEQKTIITDELILERIVEKGKGQMTYNFIEHNLYDTLLG